jgi:hypothetical protein
MRYHVTGVPAGVQLTAVMPNMVRAAGSGAQRYKQAVHGQPGTMAIPAPTRDTVPSPDIGDLAQAGTARSSDAPDQWFPQIYYQDSLTERPGAGMPIRVYSDNMLPVPAKDARTGYRSAALSRRVNQRGARQISAPRVLPVWGGPSGG